ncbi:MAG: hypothetical protein PVI06_11220 [Desulfobacterales bacterium]|jgi:hypothetical protein
MISDEDQKYILTHAYIPEHSVDLITKVSGGEPFLIDGYFCCRKGDWLILVGYPLAREFSAAEFENSFQKIKKQFRPKQISLMAPVLPASIAAACHAKQSDYFYTMNIRAFSLKGALKRAVKKGRDRLTVERSTEIGEAHNELAQEFIKRANPPGRVRELLLKMSEYVSAATQSVAVNAWDDHQNLAAYFVVDLAAKNFSTYVIGCHSKKNYTSGASDLLCYEMIKLSREYGKDYIHLGLGVNAGIRRFKQKWGGVPSLKYEMCDLALKKPSILETIFALR